MYYLMIGMINASHYYLLNEIENMNSSLMERFKTLAIDKSRLNSDCYIFITLILSCFNFMVDKNFKYLTTINIEDLFLEFNYLNLD